MVGSFWWLNHGLIPTTMVAMVPMELAMKSLGSTGVVEQVPYLAGQDFYDYETTAVLSEEQPEICESFFLFFSFLSFRSCRDF